MINLVVGSPDSGKSKIAETLAMNLSAGSTKYYIATMIPYGSEGAKRVIKHRKMREGKDFITLEWPDDIRKHMCKNNMDKDIDFSSSTVLLECMSNLVGNRMHEEENKNDELEVILKKIVAEIKFLIDRCENLVIVTNEFPIDDISYDIDTKKYVRLVSMVNDELIKLSDTVLIHKNGEWTKNENH